jgi:hypothetical protein
MNLLRWSVNHPEDNMAMNRNGQSGYALYMGKVAGARYNDQSSTTLGIIHLTLKSAMGRAVQFPH